MSEDTKKGKTVMTKDDLAAFVKEAVEGQIGEMKEVLEKEIAPLKEQATNWGAMISTPKDPEEVRKPGPEEKAMGAARICRALAAAKGDPERAAHWAEKAFDDQLGDSVIKALAAGDFTAGSFMIPEDMSNEIIPLLRARSVVRAAGTPTVPMPRGTLTLPKQTGDVTANYIGENVDIPKSEPTGGQIVLSAKKLSTLVPISNDLLDFDVGDAADRFVRDSMVRRMATREDQAFLRDQGSESTPKGLRYQAAAANITATNGTSAANIEDDFIDLINDLETANVDMSNPVWLMSPRSKNHLLNLRDANGNLIYPELRTASPTIHTFPIMMTTNIPTNLGGGTETELYLMNVSDLLIGEAGGLEITTDASASYIEGGNLVSAFSRDQTVVRALSRHDFAVMYPEAVAIKTGITWGA
jgi:HK97 family phage major capsid protein